MIIHIYDKNLNKIDLLTEYEYCSVEVNVRDIGSFEIQMHMSERYKYLFGKQQYYFMFDFEQFGKITYIGISDEDGETIKIKGVLAKYILQERVVYKTLKFTGRTYEFAGKLISRELIETNDYRRKIENLKIVYIGEDRLKQNTAHITTQVTGGTIWDAITEYLEQDKLCIDLVPVCEDEINITGFELRIWFGNDRTRENNGVHKPVVFSKKYGNVKSATYTKDNSGYRNMVYIAGEGEDADRVWKVIPRTESDRLESGWNLEELWVDARDLQRKQEQDDGTEKDLTEDEYNALLQQRAIEKLKENDKTEEYEATLVERAEQSEFSIGDYVTFYDEELNVEVDAQIMGVTKSVQDNRVIYDYSFLYGGKFKNINNQLYNLKTQLESMSVNVLYKGEKVNVNEMTEDDLDEICV